MSRRRYVVAVVAAVLSAFSGVVLVLLQYAFGLESTFGPTADLFGWLAVPLSLGLLSVVLSERRPGVVVPVLVACLATVVALPLAGAMGESRAAQLQEADDSDFACNTSGTGFSVPNAVDEAFRMVDHPADHWLRGPISGGGLGCTAELQGDATASFTAWRRSLVGSGWEVDRDDSEVVVVHEGVRLTLFRSGDLSYLNASTENADAGVDGRCAAYDQNTDVVTLDSWVC